MWLKHMVLLLCLCVISPSRKMFSWVVF
jgi:hypothetical protein